MEESRPSLTALRVAMRRAAHQLIDEPVVFADPFAMKILGPDGEASLLADPRGIDNSKLSPYIRAFVAARSRRAEEELALAVGRGVAQYVALGAGLDTFALRNPYPGLRVFEVDHPATQAWKRGLMEAAGIPTPPCLTFAALDFEHMTLAEGLRVAGLDPARPAFFSCLGVAQYLTEEAFLATLSHIASTPRGGAVVFDYALSPTLLTPAQMPAFEALSRQVAKAGEPFRSSFVPVILAARLVELGFADIEDMGQSEINERYFAGRADGLRVGSLSRLMTARL